MAKKKTAATKKPATKNPQDATLRNVRAANRNIAMVAGLVNMLNGLQKEQAEQIEKLTARVATLEDRAQKRRARGE